MQVVGIRVAGITGGGIVQVLGRKLQHVANTYFLRCYKWISCVFEQLNGSYSDLQAA